MYSYESNKLNPDLIHFYMELKLKLSSPFKGDNNKEVPSIPYDAPDAHHKIISNILLPGKQALSWITTMHIEWWIGNPRFITLYWQLNEAIEILYSPEAPDYTEEKLFAAAVNTLLFQHINQMVNEVDYFMYVGQFLSTSSINQVALSLNALIKNNPVYINNGIIVISPENHLEKINNQGPDFDPFSEKNADYPVTPSFFSTFFARKKQPSSSLEQKTPCVNSISSQSLIRFSSPSNREEIQFELTPDCSSKKEFNVVSDATWYGLKLMGIEVQYNSSVQIKHIKSKHKQNMLSFHPDKMNGKDREFRNAKFGHYLVMESEYPKVFSESEAIRDERLMNELFEFMSLDIKEGSQENRAMLSFLMKEMLSVKEIVEEKLSRLENRVGNVEKQNNSFNLKFGV